MARADVGLDFEGTPYAFLESPGFLAAVLALAVAWYALERARGRPGDLAGDEAGAAVAGARPGAAAGQPVTLALGAVAVGVGALLFAGSLAAGGSEPWPGLVAGAVAALLGFVATRGVLDRARRRLDRSAAAVLPVWADAAALALAAVAIALPPASILALPALLYLLVAGGRVQDRKYRGLRILR